jgi:pimeloyl-ACP methyl ester carboxylesterase
MATFLLLHGAASDSWYWHRVAPYLRAGGHEVIAPDLPVEDQSAGLAEYVDTAAEAAGDREDVVVVAQSLAGLIAPLLADRASVSLIVLVAAMTPAPNETGGEWWANTGQAEAARRHAIEEGRDPDADLDPVETFLHDVPADVAAESARHVRNQTERLFGDPWPLAQWPDVPTRFVLALDDRLFPADFQRRVVRERLGITPDEIDTGHLPALSKPKELADLLLQYVSDAEAALARP